jgi:hypothetical protein
MKMNDMNNCMDMETDSVKDSDRDVNMDINQICVETCGCIYISPSRLTGSRLPIAFRFLQNNDYHLFAENGFRLEPF